MKLALMLFLLSVGDPPAPRNQPGLVYDGERLLLFGGAGDEELLDDFWTFEGAWTPLSSRGPSARTSHAMEAIGDAVVIYGGIGVDRERGVERTRLGDLWLWDGSRWADRTVGRDPNPRSAHAMAFDGERERLVLFGGSVEEGLSGDTWEWDGERWHAVADTGPSARRNHRMAYDSGRGVVVLFGGADASGRLADTWEWDGRRWNEVSVAGPSARDHHGMTYDDARGEVVVFGGWAGEYLGDTWRFDGVRWSLRSETGPHARGGKPGMAYHAKERVIYLFGGWGEDGANGDLWIWDGEDWRRVEPQPP